MKTSLTISCLFALLPFLAIGADDSAQPPTLIFEAIRNEPLAVQYLEVPQDSVIWAHETPSWLDRHDNLIGQRQRDYCVYRISPDGKYRNDLLPVNLTPKPSWRLIGVDTLDRFWSFHNMSQEKDDQKQMDGTKFILHNDTGGVIKEIHPKWYLVPNQYQYQYDICNQILRDAWENAPEGSIMLENFYGTTTPSMHHGRYLRLISPMIDFEQWNLILDLDGKLIRETKADIIAPDGSEFNWQYWTYWDSDGQALQYPIYWGNSFNQENYPLEAMPEDTGKNSPPFSYLSFNNNGLVAFQIRRESDDEPRWGMRRFEFVILEVKSKHVVQHQRLSWNDDTTKISTFHQALLTSKGELLLLMNEYDPVTSWVKEKQRKWTMPGGSWYEPGNIDSVVVDVPKGGKHRFRVYRIAG